MNNYHRLKAMVIAMCWALSSALMTSCATPDSSAGKASLEADLLITNGVVIDGTGSTRYKADVAVLGDRVVFMGDSTKSVIHAKRVIDAKGSVVTPGFIDPHTHADIQLSDVKLRANQAYLFQGVTTVLTGNDGQSPWPIGKALSNWQQQGVGPNVGLFVGHGTLRTLVVGRDNKPASKEQMDQMRNMVREGMNEGAFGLSTGLFYAPAVFASTEEIVELAKVSASMGGIYDTHMRSESGDGIGLLGAIEEALQVGRESKSPIHISHIKALGSDVWGKSQDAIALIENAQRQGVKVSACSYPYVASATDLVSALIPPWAQSGGTPELIKRINDPAQRKRLDADVEKNLKTRGGPDAILFRYGSPDYALKKKLSELTKASGKTVFEEIYDLVKVGIRIPIVSFNMTEADIENFMRQKWVMTCSDSSTGHPRTYGTFARKMSEYVRVRKVGSLEQAVYSSTGQTASTFGIKDRGVLRQGAFADILIFDPEAIKDNATFLEPDLLSSGISTVVVNGQIVIDDGQYTGKLAGQALRK